MREVVLRAVQDGGVRSALAAYELERDDTSVVLHLPVGSPGLTRDGERVGPRGGFLPPTSWLPTLSPKQWRTADVVMVHRFGDPWSTWRWTYDRRTWKSGCYLNLEDPWRESPIGWDTDDLVLDVVVRGDGEIVMKDEHELAWAEGAGWFSAARAAEIRGFGAAAADHARTGGWPHRADWDAWLPRTDRLPTLPPGAAEVPVV